MKMIQTDNEFPWLLPLCLLSLGRTDPFWVIPCSPAHKDTGFHVLRVQYSSSCFCLWEPPRWQLCCGDDLRKLTGISGGPAWTREKGAPWGCWRKCYFNFKGTFCALISLGKQNAGHRMQLRNQMGDWQFGSEQVHADPAAWCEPGPCSALRWNGGGGGGNIHPVCFALN